MSHFQQGFAQQLGAVANAAQLFDIGQKIVIQGDCGSHRILQGVMDESNIAPNDAHHDASPNDLPMTSRCMSEAPS
jgi:hypothetical protein